MGEWVKGRRRSRRLTPKDELHYYVFCEVMEFTTKVLKEYGAGRPAAEGVVYWAGRRDGNHLHICAAVAPAVQASRYGFQTGYKTNGDFVGFLSDNDLQYISQVHSHPSSWVDHSEVDDRETAFRREGLLSIVVPNFGRTGIFPLNQCGVHLYTGERFRRVTDKYLRSRFHSVDKGLYPVLLKDFRNESGDMV
jgi:hypothetical protein